MTTQRFGKYTVERRLGSGGFASVWLAYDPDLDLPVAIKVLADNYTDDPEVRRRFLREARILSHLLNPAIVRIFMADTLPDGRPYFVMEDADLGTLFDLMKRRKQEEMPFSVDEAIGLSLQIAEGLRVAHQHKIVHRDLKPNNVLFCSDETSPSGQRLLLADFGIARELESAGSRTITAGTLDYMAPEQADPARSGQVDERSDIYAAAVILYELLAGTVPVHYDSLSAFVRDRQTTPPPPITEVRQGVSQELAEVIAAGLALNPEDRFASAQAWSRALESVAGRLKRRHDDDSDEQRKTVGVAEVTIQVQVLEPNGQLAAAPLAGYRFVLTPHGDQGGALVQATTGPTGRAVLQLQEGVYSITQTPVRGTTLEGYTVNGAPLQGGVFNARSGQSTTIVATNRQSSKVRRWAALPAPALYAGGALAIVLIVVLALRASACSVFGKGNFGCSAPVSPTATVPPTNAVLTPTPIFTQQPTAPPTSGPTSAPQPAPPNPAGVAYTEEFNTNSRGWPVGNQPDGHWFAVIGNGRYTITYKSVGAEDVYTPSSNWVPATGNQRIEAEVQLGSGAGYAGLAVRFRQDANGNNAYYECHIRSDDEYSCTAARLGQRQVQAIRGPSSSPAIQHGQFNHLELIAAGSTITFVINGTPVTSFVDTGNVSGVPGLLVGNYNDATTSGSVTFSSVTAFPTSDSTNATIFENFSNNNRGWPSGPEQAGNWSAAIGNGTYTVTYKTAGLEYIYVPTSQWLLATGDQRIEADVRLGAGASEAGLAVRYSAGSSGGVFYTCYIDTADKYTCEAALPNQKETTVIRGPSPSPAIQHGQSNHLELSAAGTTITFKVNGTTVTSFDDNRIATGQPGLMVGKDSQSTTTGPAAFTSVIASAGR